MAKHKVAELEGALLDAAVAKADGKLFKIQEVMTEDCRSSYDACLVAEHGQQWSKRVTDYHFWHPSTRWEHGGPIIERWRIDLTFDPLQQWPWLAITWPGDGHQGTGASEFPLQAAMRAYVTSKFGEEVDLP